MDILGNREVGMIKGVGFTFCGVGRGGSHDLVVEMRTGHKNDVAASYGTEMGGIGLCNSEDCTGFQEDGFVTLEASCIGVQIGSVKEVGWNMEKVMILRDFVIESQGKSVVVVMFDIVCTDHDAVAVDAFEKRAAMKTLKKDGIVVLRKTLQEQGVLAGLDNIGFG